MCETPIHSGIANVRSDWSMLLFTINIYRYINKILSEIWAVRSTFPHVDGLFPRTQLTRKQHGLSPAGRGYSLSREVPLNLRQSIETTLGCVRAPPKIRVLDRVAAGE